MTRTIKQWASDAVGPVQDACNLSGILFAFNDCIADLSALALGDNEIDRHPIAVAWADKLDDLARCRELDPITCHEPLTMLVPRFTEAMRLLCNENHDTDARNRHPVAQEFVRRVVYVTGSRSTKRLFDALDACKQMATGE